MTLIARYPRIAAWVISLALIAALTLGGIQALRALEPQVPASLAHMHGVIVAVHQDSVFGVRAQGQTKTHWFRPAPGAPISMQHLLRHLHERAATDIYYQARSQGVWLAWEAD
jgi:hypothetical protein